MKTMSIITTGGKYLISCVMFLLLSCDSTISLTVNDKQMLSYPLYNNEIKVSAGKFGPDYHLFISSEKPLIAQPNSFQYEFPADVSCERIDYYSYEKKHKGNMVYYCGVTLRNCKAKSIPKDNVILKILPNDYILYQGERVITDTICVNMNPKK